MAIIITILISALLSSALPYIDGLLTNIIPTALHAERYLDSLTGTVWFDSVYDIFFAFGVSVIVLRILYKGFESYIGWTDGDPDADPLQMLTRFIKALAVAICFPQLYEILTSVAESLIDTTLAAIGVGLDTNFSAIVNGVASAGIFTALCSVIFFVMFLLMYIQFLMVGLEILILRIGLPFAACGLIDSDKGVFGPYMKKFFMSTLTVVVQICVCKLGISLMINGNVFWAIAALRMALKTPRFLQEFMLSGGGGGGISQVYYTTQMVRNVTRAAFSRGSA
ncbi:DUF6102 family protein [Eubacteriales bacterium OttesenSCG-928-M02]|nr:DUF6102 family protein [Eubacteriales bacterium OttesenSCG-928-M02]